MAISGMRCWRRCVITASRKRTNSRGSRSSNACATISFLRVALTRGDSRNRDKRTSASNGVRHFVDQSAPSLQIVRRAASQLDERLGVVAGDRRLVAFSAPRRCESMRGSSRLPPIRLVIEILLDHLARRRAPPAPPSRLAARRSPARARTTISCARALEHLLLLLCACSIISVAHLLARRATFDHEPSGHPSVPAPPASCARRGAPRPLAILLRGRDRILERPFARLDRLGMASDTRTSSG